LLFESSGRKQEHGRRHRRLSSEAIGAIEHAVWFFNIFGLNEKEC
jgi:hypothetical protein